MEAEITATVTPTVTPVTSWAARHPELSALLSGTLPIAILSGSAYLTGHLFHDTRLRTVGINPELYPKDGIDNFIHAYLACLSLVAKALPFLTEEVVVLLTIIAFWCFVTGAAVVINRFENAGWAVRLRAAIVRASGLKRTAKIVSLPVIASVMTVYIPLGLVSLFALPLVIGHTAGRLDGQAYLAKAAKVCAMPGTAESRCTELREDGKLVGYGYVIDASDTYIALVEKGQGRSVRRDNKEFVTRVSAVSEPDSAKKPDTPRP